MHKVCEPNPCYQGLQIPRQMLPMQEQRSLPIPVSIKDNRSEAESDEKRATNLSRKWTRASHAHTLRHLSALTPWRHSLKNKSGQISPSGFFSDILSQTFCDLLFCDIRRQEYIYSFITQKHLAFA